MEKPKKIPLVSGLIGRETQSIHAQLEISRVDYDTINIALKRKAYSGLPDIEFSVTDTDLQEIIDILEEAKNKIDSYWLSRIATPEVQKEKT
jgi:hypothetical protein